MANPDEVIRAAEEVAEMSVYLLQSRGNYDITNSKRVLHCPAIRRQTMDLFTESIQGLTAVEKLRLVERIWDDLAAQEGPIPLPDWAVHEATRRRAEMIANPQLGMTHAEMWERIVTSRDA